MHNTQLVQKIRDQLPLYLSLFLMFDIGLSLPKLNPIFFLTATYWGFWVFQLKNFSFLKEQLELVKRPYPILFPLIFAAYSFISLTWSPNPIEGFRKSAFLFIFFTAIYAISTFAKSQKRFSIIIKIISITLWTHTTLSMLEIFTPFRWPISPISKLVNYFGRSGWGPNGGVIIDFNDYVNTLPTSFYFNPNSASMVSLISLPFFIFSNKKYVTFLGVLCSSLIISSACSKGQYVLMYLEILICIFLLIKLGKQQKEIFKNITYVLLSLILSFVIFFNTADNQKRIEIKSSFIVFSYYIISNTNNTLDKLGIKISGIDSLTDSLYGEYIESLSERSLLNQEVINHVSGVNLFGQGAGAIGSEFLLFHGKQRTIKPHNFWIELYAEYGAIILAFFLVWLFFLFTKLFKLLKNRNLNTFNSTIVIPYLISFPFFIGCLISLSLFFFYPTCIYIAFGVSLLNLREKQDKIMN